MLRRMRNPRSRRSRWWFGLIAVPVLLGTIGVIYSSRNLGSTIDQMLRVDMPGTHEVDLPAGDLTVYAEGQFAGLTCGVTDAATGEPLQVRRPSGHTTYNWGSRSGESVLAFTTPRAGRYAMTCTSTGGEHYATRLAIGGGMWGPIIGLVVATLGGMFGAGLTAVGVWLWRRRSPAAGVA